MKNYFNSFLKPDIHPINRRILFKSHAIFFALSLLLFYVFHFIAIAFYSYKEDAITDIDLSDLYYQIQAKPKPDFQDIIIINYGSIDNEEGFGRRKNLLKLLNLIIDSANCKPKKIGLDLEYVDWKDMENDLKLKQLFKDHGVVIAESKQDTSIFNDVTRGYVNFPDDGRKTVRKYYNWYKIQDSMYSNSFANAYLDKPRDTTLANEFYLKYYCKGKGYYDVLNKDDEEETTFAFPAIEASAILKGLPNAELRKLFHNKMILIGHLGEGNMHNQYDIIDKHKSPTDMEFIAKSKIMPGVVIHANAIKQLYLGKKIFDFNWLSYIPLIYVITLCFTYILLLIENIHNIFLRIVVELFFMIGGVLVLNYFLISLMGIFIHINTLYVAIGLIFLLEMKGSMFEFYHKNLYLVHKKK